MSGPLGQALAFLLSTVFDLYTMVVAVRFLLQTVRADYFNPLAQVVVKLSNPPLLPLRRLVPGIRGLDIASLVLCLLLIIAKIAVFKLLALAPVQLAGYGFEPAALNAAAIAVLAPTDLLNLLINVLLFSMLILVVLSWISPMGGHPVAEVLAEIVDPLVAPVRQHVKPMGGLDFSMLIAMVLLQVVKILSVGTLLSLVF